MKWLLLLTALSVSAVAAWYSIAGLAAIFAAAAIPVIIMGGVLETGKLVAVTYLHRFWDEAPKLLRAYLVFAVAFLMFITSMGIFGFLSKAHIEQGITGGDNSVQITRLDSRIGREQRAIRDAEQVIGQLDQAVQVLIDNDRIRGSSGSISTRANQKPERDQLALVIRNAETAIDSLEEEKLVLSKDQILIEAEVGPIKYIAELIYGETSRTVLEDAVRWVIILLVIVFDPLAVALLIAWNDVIKRERTSRKVEVTEPKSFEQIMEETPDFFTKVAEDLGAESEEAIQVPEEVLEQMPSGSWRKKKKKTGGQ
jgi:hypothetical protein